MNDFTHFYVKLRKENDDDKPACLVEANRIKKDESFIYVYKTVYNINLIVHETEELVAVFDMSSIDYCYLSKSKSDK